MSVAESTAANPQSAAAVKPRATRKPLFKRAMHAIRRAHLYLGLFLIPWAILYGVTAFLFNHPTAFSDSASVAFGADLLAETPMGGAPTAEATAEAVVAALNDRAKDGVRYALAATPPAVYARDSVSAAVKAADGSQITVTFDVTGSGGSVRTSPPRPEPKPTEKAPFAVGGGAGAAPGRGQRGGGPPSAGRGPRDSESPRPPEALKHPDPLHERVKATVPTVLERSGLAGGDVTVAAVPDLTFRMTDAAGKAWKVTANGLTGTVAGSPADDAKEPTEISVRRFLTRLHLSHGYPSSGGVRWWWAVIVDAMAFVMCFWGLSGLLMWWQIKATRKLGLVALVLSAAAGTWLAVGMYDAFTR